MIIDARGLSCPLPVLKANKALKGLPAGATLTVLATDAAAAKDFAAFCATAGHELLSIDETDGGLRIALRKKPEPG